MSNNLYNNNENIHSNQIIYDSFNDFVFSKDRNVFNKLISRAYFYDKTRNLHGDIVECGVFKGSGLLTWLKLIDMHEKNSIKKVIGFDYFNPNFVDQLKNDVDKKTMSQVFTRDADLAVDELSVECITQKILGAGFDSSKFELIKGNICETATTAVLEKPGFRISILYLDLDLEEPTAKALEALWDRVVSGGFVVFDEYAYHSWSEANAVDEFCRAKNLKLYNTHLKTPTAYIIK